MSGQRKSPLRGRACGWLLQLFVRYVHLGEVDNTIMVSRPKQLAIMHFTPQRDVYCMGAGYIQRRKVLRWLADINEGRPPQGWRELLAVLADEVFRIHALVNAFPFTLNHLDAEFCSPV